jgi:hypothetical protein
VFLRKQSFELRAQTIRRALARVSANLVADELLAIYFLECRKPHLIEWLDLVGLAHEDGTLKDETPRSRPRRTSPRRSRSYRGTGEDPDRDLLQRAFAAQSAVSVAGARRAAGIP